MPYIIRPRQIFKLAAGMFSSLVVLSAAPALASASCPSSSAASQVFAALGDSAHYTLVEGGTFESGAKGWSLRNAEVIEDSSAPLKGKHSLLLKGDGEAVSPGFCVNAEYPSYRFFAHQRSGGYFGALNVSLRWVDSYGYPHEALAGQLNPLTGWALSPVLDLAGRLPLWMSGGTLNGVKLVFRPNYGSEWTIDDVYIDPYSR
jgi:hypothetical protein